jgi:hypothetical protein
VETSHLTYYQTILRHILESCHLPRTLCTCLLGPLHASGRCRQTLMCGPGRQMASPHSCALPVTSPQEEIATFTANKTLNVLNGQYTTAGNTNTKHKTDVTSGAHRKLLCTTRPALRLLLILHYDRYLPLFSATGTAMDVTHGRRCCHINHCARAHVTNCRCFSPVRLSVRQLIRVVLTHRQFCRLQAADCARQEVPASLCVSVCRC